MKKVVLTLALVGFGTFAMAQTQRTPEQIAKMETRKVEMQQKRAANQEAHFAKMKTDLNLNDTQVAKIRSMQTEMKSTRQEEMKNRKEMNKESATKMKAKREMMNNEMKTILTPDQFKKWEMQKMADQKERKSKMQNRKGKMQKMRMHKNDAAIS